MDRIHNRMMPILRVIPVLFVLFILMLPGILAQQDSKVAEWKFDEATTITPDSTGNGHDGTLINGPNLVPGRIGNALSFNSNQMQGVSVPHSEQLNFGSESFTISVWVKYGADNPDADIIRKGSTNTAQNWYKLELKSNFIQFNINTASKASTSATAPFTSSDNNWHHVAAVRDTTANRLFLYIDGEVVQSVADPGATTSNTANIGIGIKDTLIDDPFHGALDEVAIYNQALSESDIRQLASLPGNNAQLIILSPKIGEEYIESLPITYDIQNPQSVSRLAILIDQEHQFFDADIDGSIVLESLSAGNHDIDLWLEDSSFAEIGNTRHSITINIVGPDDIPSILRVVSNYWTSRGLGNNGWADAAFYTGHLAASAVVSANDRHNMLNIAFDWAEHNAYNIRGGTSSVDADNHAAGHSYLYLYNVWPELSSRSKPDIRNTEVTIHNIVANPDPSHSCPKRDNQVIGNEDWCWVDAIFMALPVYTEIGLMADNGNSDLVFSNPGADYYNKMFDLFIHAKDIEDSNNRMLSGTGRGLYDKEDFFWYRDRSFIDSQTSSGKKIYWSRGNGWVFAALARTLDRLPLDAPHRDEYRSTFIEMANSIRTAQRSDGFWNMNLGDSSDAPGPETSGTGFFTYGLAWGINNGVLDKAVYLPVVDKAWNGLLSAALHPNGKIGFVQDVGSKPTSNPPNFDDTTNFGVGAFLLAASEVLNIDKSNIDAPLLIPLYFEGRMMIIIETDEPAVCKYSDVAGTDYVIMPHTFRSTGTHHDAQLGLLSQGDYSYFAKCKDSSGNINNADFEISFVVGKECELISCTAVIKYISLSYLPLDGQILDSSLTGVSSTLNQMRSKISNMNLDTRQALEQGTIYHGYFTDQEAYIRYEQIDSIDFLKSIPVSSNSLPWNPSVFRPDYDNMLNQDVDICDYVDNKGVSEVWIWGYHFGNIEPVESNMAMGTKSASNFNWGSYGDISNSEQTNDLPVCQNTYTVYNYNYARSSAEAVHNHMHQFEQLFGWADNDLFWNKWVGTVAGTQIVNPGCGSAHNPPNSREGIDYDYDNTIPVLSDCENWNPTGTGFKSSVSCATWGCNQDGGLRYYIWWMQNIPGLGNDLTYQGMPLRNWWELTADFDFAAENRALTR